MKFTQGPWIALAAQAVLAGAPRADTVAAITPSQGTERTPERIDSGRLPVACRQFLELPADARGDWLTWAQRLSLAACEQARSTPVASDANKLPEVVAALDRALQPSVAIYKDAMAHGPAQIQMLAAYGLGMGYVNVIVRARASIPAAGDLMTNLTAADTYIALHHALEPMLVSYAHQAATAFREADRLATADPVRASANPTMQHIVATARAELRALHDK